MKDAIGRTIGVIDESGAVVACSDLTKIGETRAAVREELSYVSDCIKHGGVTYRPLVSGPHSEYIVLWKARTLWRRKCLLCLPLH